MKGLLLRTTLIASVAVLLASGWHYLDTSALDGEGRVEVDIRQLNVNNDQLSLDAHARVSLPPTVVAGLDNGVPLTFVLDLQITEPNSLWLDSTLFTLERHFRLTYYELTRHYRVEVQETRASQNFRSLSSALAGMGELLNFAVSLDHEQAERLKPAGLMASLSLRLSRSALPLPLQPIFRSSWTLASQEYRWPVT